MLGFIQRLDKDEGSKTGYSATILEFKKDVRTVPAAESAYQLKFDPKFEHPKFEELLFILTLDEEGVLSDIEEYPELATISYGGEIKDTLILHQDSVEFTGFQEALEREQISFWGSYNRGEAEPITGHQSIPLSDDVAFYCFDWTSDHPHTYPCDVETLNRYMEDNLHWIHISRVNCAPGYYDEVTGYRNNVPKGGPKKGGRPGPVKG